MAEKTDSQSGDQADSSDPRGLALIVFQKFHRELPRLDERPGDRALRELVMEAINLLPDYEALKGDKRSHIYLKPRGHASDDPGIAVNIQETLDCLRTLWEEYRREVAEQGE